MADLLDTRADQWELEQALLQDEDYNYWLQSLDNHCEDEALYWEWRSWGDDFYLEDMPERDLSDY